MGPGWPIAKNQPVKPLHKTGKASCHGCLNKFTPFKINGNCLQSQCDASTVEQRVHTTNIPFE